MTDYCCSVGMIDITDRRDGCDTDMVSGAVRDRSVRRLDNGQWVSQQLTLIDEALVSITVNGGEPFDIRCSPCDLRELIIGRLFCDGVISSSEEITDFILHTDTLSAEIKTVQGKVIQKTKNTAFTWKTEWIEELARNINSSTPIFNSTRSAHSCQLMQGGKIVCCMEDIGRHNAMDKSIGWALENGISLSECILFTSGRMPCDSVRKLIRAGIPVAASKAMPSAQAAELAALHGIKLLHISPQLGLIEFT